ncbi:hypothetical protein BH24ACT4_BH24ACT4_13600 [soil metagenome]
MIRTVLAVGHDASRTGAPATLLSLMGWAHAERDVAIDTVLLGAGPLVEEFRKLGPVRAQPPALTFLQSAVAATGAGRPAAMVEATWLRRALRPAVEADVVFVSSAAALRAVPLLPRGGPPVVAHVHEMDGVLSALGGVEHMSGLLLGAALVLAPSPEVAELCARPVVEGGLAVPSGRIRHHPAPVTPPARHPRPPVDDAALVVGCGRVGWRKGTDLFVALADAVGPTVGGRAVHWHWIGGDSGDRSRADVLDEIRLRGLEGRVRLDGESEDAPARLAAADLLVITSREDPYPLVAAEAALTGTPVVGFRPGTTLLTEAGHPERRVDHLDIDALARQVVELLQHPSRGRLLASEQARAAATATTPLVAPAIWADIETAVRQAAAG